MCRRCTDWTPLVDMGRRSLHATVTIPVQPAPPPAAAVTQTEPLPPPAPAPQVIATPRQVSPPVPKPPEVEVDVTGDQVTVHAHPAGSSPHHPNDVRSRRSSPHPQTIVEVFPPHEHHASRAPTIIHPQPARTDVTIAPTHSIRSPPQSIGPQAIVVPEHVPQTRHHTHLFPHSASTTSESLPGGVSHGFRVLDPGENARVGYSVPVLQRFTDIRPIPIS
jgi:hypothetical protein